MYTNKEEMTLGVTNVATVVVIQDDHYIYFQRLKNLMKLKKIIVTEAILFRGLNCLYKKLCSTRPAEFPGLKIACPRSCAYNEDIRSCFDILRQQKPTTFL